MFLRILSVSSLSIRARLETIYCVNKQCDRYHLGKISSSQSYEWINKKDFEGITRKSTFGRNEWNEDNIIVNMDKTIKRLGEEIVQEKDVSQRWNKGRKGIYGVMYALCAYFLFPFSYSAQICKLGLRKECICNNFIIFNDIMLTFVLTYFKPWGKQQVDQLQECVFPSAVLSWRSWFSKVFIHQKKELSCFVNE